MKKDWLPHVCLSVPPLFALIGGGLLSREILQSVSIAMPIGVMVIVLLGMEVLLLKMNLLPKMPQEMTVYLKVSALWSFGLLQIGFATGFIESEAKIVAPLLWLGLLLMYWIFMVCTREVVEMIFAGPSDKTS